MVKNQSRSFRIYYNMAQFKFFSLASSLILAVLLYAGSGVAEDRAAQQSVAPLSVPTEQLAQSEANAVPLRTTKQKAEDKARSSFDTFTRDWMQKLVASEDFQKKRE